MEQPNKLSAFASFYYLLKKFDDEVLENELLKTMCEHENLDLMKFFVTLDNYDDLGNSLIYNICIKSLKQCSHDTQVSCMAWMINIAYSDTIMTDDEWKLIYKIYKAELGLKHSDILLKQRKLPNQFGLVKQIERPKSLPVPVQTSPHCLNRI
jgi:hypothetical protein